MARITYITKEDKSILFHLSRSSKTIKTLGNLLDIDFKNLDNNSVTKLESSEELLDKLKSINY